MIKKSKKIYFFIFVLVLILTFGVLLGLNFFNGKSTSLNIFKKNQSSSKSFVFAIAGDNHENVEVYKELIQKVNASQAVFFVDLGDTTRVSGLSEYVEKKAMLNDLKVPYHMVIGHHDIVGNGYDYWQQYFGATYYSWDYENAHFVVLDDVSYYNAFSEDELAWLEKDLSSNPKQLKFVFLHSPPRCPFVDPSQLGFKGPNSEERIDKFLSIIKKYKIDQIYAAHIHNLLNYKISGIPITVTGGAGGPLYHIPLIGKDTYHFLEIEVSGSNFKQKVIEL